MAFLPQDSELQVEGTRLVRRSDWFQVSGLGFQIWGFGSQVSGFESQISGFGMQVSLGIGGCVPPALKVGSNHPFQVPY